ncbi:MAG: hypothetical protein KKA84_06775 [Bacteroidetes bacterium]|nr:hypothetical protein [Bacteroidota bacterium]
MTKYYLTTDSDEFELEIDLNNPISEALLKDLPLVGVGNNIGGEVYFNLSNDIPFNGDEKDVFEIGDVVYWRSTDTVKFAIAILYGNTKFGDGTKPRTFSPCIKFAKVKNDVMRLADFKSGAIVKIFTK